MVMKQKRKKIKLWKDKKKRKWILILVGVCILGAGGTTFFMTRLTKCIHYDHITAG